MQQGGKSGCTREFVELNRYQTDLVPVWKNSDPDRTVEPEKKVDKKESHNRNKRNTKKQE